MIVLVVFGIEYEYSYLFIFILIYRFCLVIKILLPRKVCCSGEQTLVDRNRKFWSSRKVMETCNSKGYIVIEDNTPPSFVFFIY
jgi:hypothetical protein